MFVALLALAGYIAMIPFANVLIETTGTNCWPLMEIAPPCTVPVWPGIMCPSGSLMIGLALVLRDIVQRGLGKWCALLAIVIGVIVAAVVAPPSLVIASATAFFVSELADFAIYTPLYRTRFMLAVFLAAIIGLVVDSVIFLWIAFGSQDLLAGLIIGKAEMVIVALPMMWMVKRYYERLDRQQWRAT